MIDCGKGMNSGIDQVQFPCPFPAKRGASPGFENRRKEATVRRYHYDSHHQLRQHIQTFLDAYNFAKRLKTLNGLTPFESVCTCDPHPCRRQNLASPRS
jgi:hypothetical protein